MKDNHFFEAYIRSKDIYVDEHELRQIRKDKVEYFFKEYDENMFCPECKRAQLELEFGSKIKVLRTKKGETHTEDCPYIPEASMITMKHVLEYAKTVKPQTRNNNLWSLMSRLDSKQNDYSPNTNLPLHADKSVFTVKLINERKTTRVYIPRQKIGYGKEIFSYGIPTYYYGNVYLAGKNQEKHFQLMLFPLRDEKKRNLICSVFISKKINNLVDKFINKDVNGQYHIAFYGKMVLRNEIYNNLYIYDENDIATIRLAVK